MVMTSLTERLVGKGTRQAMEYEEELVYNAPAIACNAVGYMAKKLEDNILHAIKAPVIALQPIAPSNPAANLSCAFLKA